MMGIISFFLHHQAAPVSSRYLTTMRFYITTYTTLIITSYHVLYLPAQCLSFSPSRSRLLIQRRHKNVVFEVEEKKIRNTFSVNKVVVSSKLSSYTPTIMSLSTTKIKNTTEIFLRFSPLIGGPSNIPLHVEVMMLKSAILRVCPFNDGNNNDNSQRETSIRCLHRFDFLPAEPTKMETIQKLISLQYVPGLLRHRILISGSGSKEDDHYDLKKIDIVCNDTENNMYYNKLSSIVPNERVNVLIGNNNGDTHTDLKGDEENDFDSSSSSLVFKIYNTSDSTSIAPAQSLKESSIDKKMIIDNLIQIPQEINDLLDEKKKSELHLIFNNCYSFSWDVLQSLRLLEKRKYSIF